MTEFEVELMRRSPLAAAVLEIADYTFTDQVLASIWASHRGRCYDDKLTFPRFVGLMRDALVNHGGSAHRLFVDLETRNAHPVDESNFYRKLAKMPAALSRAFLREATARLAGLLPAGAGVTLPRCFDDYTVVIGDGKKIKNAAKRLAPARGFSGSLLGAAALVALDARSGLALAMNDSLDGMTNDVPLVAGLIEQLHGIVPGPMLSVWDRQFDDVRTLRRFSARDGDAFVARAKQNQAPFSAETCIVSIDKQGRRVSDEIGTLGTGERAMRLRRVTLHRPGEDDVVLLSNLSDRVRFPAAALLELYQHRWGIEQVFQQITETFSLSHLIGGAPQAVLMQFAYCLVLYNLMQVVKAYVAADGGVLGSVVSMFYLFHNVRRELSAWAYHTDGVWPRAGRDTRAMCQRLGELLKGSWNPVAYTKRSDAQPRAKPQPKVPLHGGYSSMQRVLQGTARVAETTPPRHDAKSAEGVGLG